MPDNKPFANYEEITASNTFEIQAFICILKRQGLTDEDEMLREIEILRDEWKKRIENMGKDN